MYPNQNAPTKINSYIAIIEKCHQVITEIGMRVDIMRSPTEATNKNKDAVPCRNILEKELENLFSVLVELKESINN